MAPLTSIRTSEGKLEIVDQLLLPHTTAFIPIETIEHAHGAIKTMRASDLAVSLILSQLNVTLPSVDSWRSSDRVPCSIGCSFASREVS